MHGNIKVKLLIRQSGLNGGMVRKRMRSEERERERKGETEIDRVGN